jgi:hypothetical protein
MGFTTGSCAGRDREKHESAGRSLHREEFAPVRYRCVTKKHFFQDKKSFRRSLKHIFSEQAIRIGIPPAGNWSGAIFFRDPWAA